MSSTAVIDRPIFKSAEYLAELVRRNKAPGESASAEPKDVPPYAPTSAFMIGDEVIECEVE
jgi:hypothetical protein